MPSFLQFLWPGEHKLSAAAADLKLLANVTPHVNNSPDSTHPTLFTTRQVKHGKLEAELSSGIVVKRLLRYIACVSFTLCAGHGASE